MACCRVHHSFDEYDGYCFNDDYCYDDGDDDDDDDDHYNDYYCN